ncbi:MULTISPECIES: hypothetical protein [unclassified Rhizobium]|uniref:gp53-like domain-containing protein n=1 Tax=unclassified Rhizobium TaxID=2613769 RepID=UPI0016225A05|nr:MULTISPECIES: hypothetical protein [unclassified Rhizobium]MBB3288150.1 hypothetical protein [Rhizobium sp. BK252]MBB3402986.1 hypothetical protein [Rhizobium sp. BK289]MBB3415563.1 hypothetical protein [Rhizobium sp. BK284]MBB3483356.1 hypothetical protein [Rhizobium sp. BK347]
MANYTAGTITLINGSKVVNGTGTAWQTALIVGGIIYPEAAGNPLPFSAVTSDTQITADVAWKGTSGTYSYALTPDTAYDRQVLANSSALAQILQQLKSTPIAALSALTPAADKMPYFTGANVAALADLTGFGRSLIGDANAAAALTTLGVSTFIQGMLNDADASTALSTLGVSTFIKGLFDDPDASTALGTLGVSAFAKTLLDDVDASTALSTLGVSAFAKTILDDTSGGAVYATIGATQSLVARGYQRLPSGVIFQWGYESTTSTDFAITFPIAFPVNLAFVGATMNAAAPANTLYSLTTATQSRTGTSFLKRYAQAGGVGQAPEPFYWLAVGW